MNETKYSVPVGKPGRPCEACGKMLYFVRTAAGKQMPVEADGTPHWGNCTNTERFKKGRKKSATDKAVEEVPLRALLDWYMCSDPWPGGSQEAITKWLNAVCRQRGFMDWTMAYHELGKDPP